MARAGDGLWIRLPPAPGETAGRIARRHPVFRVHDVMQVALDGLVQASIAAVCDMGGAPSRWF